MEERIPCIFCIDRTSDFIFPGEPAENPCVILERRSERQTRNFSEAVINLMNGILQGYLDDVKHFTNPVLNGQPISH